LNYKNGYKLEITDDNENKIDEVVVEEKENYIYFKINRKSDEELIIKVTLTPL
jgi:hypothetical protein